MKLDMKQFTVLALTFFLVITAIIVAASRNKALKHDAGESHSDSSVKHATAPHVPDDFVPRTFLDDEDNKKRAKLLRFELERDGALAEVDCRVADRFGNPIPNASIRFYFNVPEYRSESEGVVEGKTNQDGRFHARHKTTYACHWRIKKEGYYESRGILPFSNHFSWDEGRNGRWTAEPLPLDVVLDDKSGVELWHGRVFRHVSFPTNTWVWFDFEAGDCVEPYGKGKNKHVSFYSEGLADPRIGFRSGIGWTNYFAFSASPNGGVSLLNEKKSSAMPFCHEAPESFDAQKLEFSFARSRHAIFFDSNPKEGQYIVFQTPYDASSGEKPHYGVIRNIECWPGGIRMEWFFNKTSGDRRIDGDITSPFDFKR